MDWVCNSVHRPGTPCLRKVPTNETIDITCVGGHWSGKIACFDSRTRLEEGDRAEVCGVWYKYVMGRLVHIPEVKK
jgi:hypothetical protein